MFVYDQAMADLVFDYCRERLADDPVALDLPGDKARLDAALAGLILPGGRDPAYVMGLYHDQLAPAIISVDSPRYLSFIPATAVTVTRLAHDR